MAVLLGAASPARAEPDAVLDPVMKLLAEHGLKPNVREAPPHADAGMAQPLTEAAAGLFDRVQTQASSMAITAMNFVGVRYQRGGTSVETGFDCSGFTRHIYEMSVGLALPRRADQQAKAPGFVEVARAALQPGDLVFFHTLKSAFSHVGIYLGDNRFIHAPSAGGHVRIEDMGFAYWRKRFDGARRPGTQTAVSSVTSFQADTVDGVVPAPPVSVDAHAAPEVR